MRALIHVGFKGMVAAGRIVAVANSNSAPIKRMVRGARQEGTLIDLTYGRKRRAVIFLDSGHLALAAIGPEAIAARLRKERRQLEGSECCSERGDSPSTPTERSGAIRRRLD